jgi:hypothetical protein
LKSLSKHPDQWIKIDPLRHTMKFHNFGDKGILLQLLKRNKSSKKVTCTESEIRKASDFSTATLTMKPFPQKIKQSYHMTWKFHS